MEEILQSISNPYSMENYERLFDTFLNSEDYSQFYAQVVTYFQDRSKEGNVTVVENNSKFTRTEFMNIWHVMRKFSDFFPTEHRIYINAPTDKVGIIVSKFMEECDSKKLPFELKYATEQIKRNDSIVIGSNTEAYRKHIEILRQIAEENPEIVEACGTPPLLTGVLDGWMGLADENVSNRFTSYTESRLKAFVHSVNKFLYENLDVAHQIGAEEIESIDKIIKEYEEDEEFLDDMISDASLSIDCKRKLGEYISENPEVLGQIYTEFFKQCAKRDMDPESPLFYNGSRKQLLENEHSKKVDITDEVRDKMQNNTSTIVANMYFKEGISDKLSIESRVEILENIIGKELKDRKEEMLMYKDLTFLHEIGFVDDELMSEIKQNLYPAEKCRALESYFEYQVGANHLDNNKKRFLSSVIKNNGEPLSDDEIKQKIDERKNEIIEYFSRPQILPEKKEQRIEAEEKLLNEVSKDRTFPYATRSSIRLETELLRADIDQFSEKREIRKKICAQLQSKEIDENHISKAQEVNKPRKAEFDFWDL